MFTAINLTEIKHSIDDIAIDAATILRSIQSIFSTFAPFHVVIKLFGQEELTDRYQVGEVFGLYDNLCLRVGLPMYDATPSGDTDQTCVPKKR